MHALREPALAAPTDTTNDSMVRAHLAWVWRYLRMHGATPHEADDLAQEAFVVALRKHATELEPAATAAFLRRTARFLFLRRRRQGIFEVSALDEFANAVDATWDRDCRDDRGDGMLAALRVCVEVLEGRMRRAVELSYGWAGEGEASRARIASELGMTENGVKTLLQRVRQRLRECVTRRRT